MPGDLWMEPREDREYNAIDSTLRSLCFLQGVWSLSFQGFPRSHPETGNSRFSSNSQIKLIPWAMLLVKTFPSTFEIWSLNPRIQHKVSVPAYGVLEKQQSLNGFRRIAVLVCSRKGRFSQIELGLSESSYPVNLVLWSVSGLKFCPSKYIFKFCHPALKLNVLIYSLIKTYKAFCTILVLVIHSIQGSILNSASLEKLLLRKVRDNETAWQHEGKCILIFVALC